VANRTMLLSAFFHCAGASFRARTLRWRMRMLQLAFRATLLMITELQYGIGNLRGTRSIKLDMR
jgi:hypothetical protein